MRECLVQNDNYDLMEDSINLGMVVIYLHVSFAIKLRASCSLLSLINRMFMVSANVFYWGQFN